MAESLRRFNKKAESLKIFNKKAESLKIFNKKSESLRIFNKKAESLRRELVSVGVFEDKNLDINLRKSNLTKIQENGKEYEQIETGSIYWKMV
jgi:hypothetical protein